MIEAWRLIASKTALPYVPPTRPLLIGLDESGTTEPAGPPIMVAAIVPSTLALQIWDIVELADTKGGKRSVSYWSELIDELATLRAKGLDFIVHEVPTERCESPGPKPLLDAVYKDVLDEVFLQRDPANCRVVVDNYGIGAILCARLMGLQDAGAEVVPSLASNCPRD